MSKRIVRLALTVAVLVLPRMAWGQASTSGIRVYATAIRPPMDSVSRDLNTYALLALRFNLARATSAQLIGEASPSCDAGLNPVSQAAPSRATNFFDISVAASRVSAGVYELEIGVGHCTARGTARIFHEDATIHQETIPTDVQALAKRVVDQIAFDIRTPVRIVTRGSVSGVDSASLRRGLNDVLRTQPTLRPADSLALDSIRVRFAAASTAVFSFFGPTLGALDTVVVNGLGTDGQDKLARAMSGALRAGIYGATVVQSGHAAPSRDSTIARVHDALCLDAVVACRPDQASAAATLRSYSLAADPVRADVTSLTDVDIVTLIGYTRAKAGDRGGAFEAFQRALALSHGKTKPLLRQSDDLALRKAIGDLYADAGNFALALRQYEPLLAESKLDTALAIQFVRTMRSSGRAFDAFVRATDLVGQFGPPMQDIALELLGDVEPSALAVSIDDAKRRCHSADIDRQCAGLFASQGNALAKLGGSSEQVQRLLLAGDSRSRPDTARLAEIAVARASAALGAVNFPYQDNRLSIQAAAIKPGDVRAALAEFDSLILRFGGGAQRPALASSTELSFRVRAVLEALAGNYDDAMRLTAHGDSVLPNPAAATLRVQLAFIDATRDSAGRLARLPTARILLDSAFSRYPKDPAVLAMRSLVCGEIAVDFSCAFDVAKKRMALSRNLDVRARIELVEAAVLADQFKTARDWIGEVKLGKSAVCERVLVAFYDYWADSWLQKDHHAAHRYAVWTAALTDYWADPAQNGRCWLFGGALKRLEAGPPTPLTFRLLQMLKVMRVKGSPLPEVPVGTSSS